MKRDEIKKAEKAEIDEKKEEKRTINKLNSSEPLPKREPEWHENRKYAQIPRSRVVALPDQHPCSYYDVDENDKIIPGSDCKMNGTVEHNPGIFYCRRHYNKKFVDPVKRANFGKGFARCKTCNENVEVSKWNEHKCGAENPRERIK